MKEAPWRSINVHLEVARHRPQNKSSSTTGCYTFSSKMQGPQDMGIARVISFIVELAHDKLILTYMEFGTVN